MHRLPFRVLVAALLALLPSPLRSQAAAAAPAVTEPAPLPGVDHFRLRSALLSAFWKKDMVVEAGVVRPLDWKAGERLPVAYNVHGFGGSHRVAWRLAPRLQEGMKAGTTPRMLYVYLNAQFEHGHHVFADSKFNGPWGRALTTEFIPALEAKFTAAGELEGRFLTGHSSGGWSTLWLQVAYPDFFGGCWSTAPDSVDFRDFTGIDIYTYKSAYDDPAGQPIMLMRREGKFVASIRQFMEMEQAKQPVGGQFYSFNAVFGEAGPDGAPRRLFDPRTGLIDRAVAESWKPYDLRLVITGNWKTLGPKLAGKVHVYMGTQDTFRLEGALKLLKADLDQLGSDAQILFVEGRDHFTLGQPHPDLWPTGMMDRIHREMHEAWQRSRKAAKAA
jgi:S-formylglutathione hydrolase FrmB